MINNEKLDDTEKMIKQSLFDFLPHAPDSYLEIVEQWDCPKQKPPDDEWGFSIVELYFQQEENTIDDINCTLDKDQISLMEAAHLIVGLKIDKMSSILSKPIRYIYQRAMPEIRNGKLKVEMIDENQFWNNRPFEEEITINSSDGKCVVRIQECKHGLAHYFKPHIFIDWALSRGLLLTDDLLCLIRVLPVAKCCTTFQATELSTNYILDATPTLPTLQQLEDVILLATAQVLWEMKDPHMTITGMEQTKEIRSVIPGGGYSNRHIFRNKVKLIDPRLAKGVVRKNRRILDINPNPPKIIPGIFRVFNDNQVYFDFLRLKTLLHTVAKAMLKINPSMELDQLINHRLILLYIKDVHPMIKLMASEWIKEIILNLNK